jgi:spore germination protein KB
MPFVIAQFTVRDSWITGLLFAVGGLLAAATSALFVKVFPGRSLTGALIDAWGPWVGRLLGLWFLGYLYVTNCTVLREAQVFMGTTILPKTPVYLIGLIVVLAISYAVHLGGEVIGRDSEFITPLALLVAPLLFALSMQHFDIHHLRPVLADGWSPVLRGAVVPDLGFGLQLLIGLQFLPSLRHGRKLTLDILIATGILTVTLTLVIAITVGVVGPSMSYRSYPVLETVRSISIGNFVDRIDTLYVIGVLSTIWIKLIAFQYAWCEGMKDVFRLSSHRRLAFSGGLLMWAGSIACYRDTSDMMYQFVHMMAGYTTVTMIGLPLLAALAMVLRRRLGGTKATGRSKSV